MRRILIAGAALAVLATATTALAATGGFNTYKAPLGFGSNKAGSSSSPAPIGITDNYVANGTGGNRTAPLTDILTKIYGVVPTASHVPVCSFNLIKSQKSVKNCPAGSQVASGHLTASIGLLSKPAQAGVACDPLLEVYNSGGGKITFFFVTTPTHICFNGAITTGFVGPYQGTITMQGKYLVLDVPIPHYVSYPIKGLSGSLTTEHLTYVKSFQASVGCLHGTRPYAVTFTAKSFAGVKSSTTVTGSAKCTK
jgi:hypothetical protein